MPYLPCFARRRRHYAQLDLKQLLKSHDIDTDMLMPKPMDPTPVLLNEDPDNPAPFPPYLPLHIFDNEEKDIRTPAEWTTLGKVNGVRKPVPGKALLPVAEEGDSNGEWLECVGTSLSTSSFSSSFSSSCVQVVELLRK